MAKVPSKHGANNYGYSVLGQEGTFAKNRRLPQNPTNPNPSKKSKIPVTILDAGEIGETHSFSSSSPENIGLQPFPSPQKKRREDLTGWSRRDRVPQPKAEAVAVAVPAAPVSYHHGKCRGENWNCPGCNKIKRKRYLHEIQKILQSNYSAYPFHYEVSLTGKHKGGRINAHGRLRSAWGQIEKEIQGEIFSVIGIEDGYTHKHVLIISKVPIDLKKLLKRWCKLTKAKRKAQHAVRLQTKKDLYRWTTYMINNLDFLENEGQRFVRKRISRTRLFLPSKQEFEIVFLDEKEGEKPTKSSSREVLSHSPPTIFCPLILRRINTEDCEYEGEKCEYCLELVRIEKENA